jgi:hypothetical protein
MSKQITQALDDRPAKTAGSERVKGDSPDVISVSGGAQANQKRVAKRGKATNMGASPQGGLPVLSTPGGNQTDSKVAHKSGEGTNTEVSPQGALPVISVPGGA